MNKLAMILVLGMISSSCTFGQKSLKNKDFDNIVEDLLERKNYAIPDSLFSFFPNKSVEYKYLAIEEIIENATNTKVSYEPYLFITYKIVEVYQCENIELLQSLIQKYRQQSIFSVKSESSDYFSISSEIELLKKYDTLQLQENLKVKNIVSLSFKDVFYNNSVLYDSATICGLPTGYEILVLKSGSDFVLPPDYLYEWLILPENLRHGYRNGVTFKENELYIIYWVVAW